MIELGQKFHRGMQRWQDFDMIPYFYLEYWLPSVLFQDINGVIAMPQMQLPFFPDGATEINANLGFIKEENQVTYIYGHLPIFQHDIDDIRTFRMIISQIYLNGSAKQSEICRAFGVSAVSVKRAVKQYRKKGSSGFYEEPQRRGAAVMTADVLKEAQQLLDNGSEVSEVAQALGVKKDTLRKAVNAGRLHKITKKKS